MKTLIAAIFLATAFSVGAFALSGSSGYGAPRKTIVTTLRADEATLQNWFNENPSIQVVSVVPSGVNVLILYYPMS